jgi:alcohol dehydrogenase, propanol-preferring
MNMLRRRVGVVLVGLFGGELELNLVTFPTRAYRLIGSYIGTLNNFRVFVSLAKKVIIKPVISIRFKLDESTKALQILKDNKIIEEV